MRDSKKQAIFDTAYWRKRLVNTPSDDPHKAIFLTNLPTWKAIEEQHKKLLADYIQPSQSVLDVGCGWGRLLTLMPVRWYGGYLGIDLSPDFIDLAKVQNPDRQNQFVVADARHDLAWTLEAVKWDEKGGQTYFSQGVKRDWAVLVSIRGMVINNAGGEVWALMESRIKEVVNKILILEYSVDDKGEVL